MNKHYNQHFIATQQRNTSRKYVHLGPGNIIPQDWYQTFTNDRGVADLSLISVLSEIVYWYRPQKIKDPATMAITYVNKFLGDAWQTSYEHFEKKFGFNREKVRRIFVKLEQMRICTREFRNVSLRGQTYNNRLFIHLSSEFLDSCIIHKENNYTDCNNSISAPKNEGGYPHLRGDHIIDTKNNINKDRSMKSNFKENSFLEDGVGGKTESNDNQDPLNQQQQPLPSSVGRSAHEGAGRYVEDKDLHSFYPLTSEDASQLRANSGRDFSLNAMNEILLDMSKRLTDRFFKSKKSFLSYMSKVFANEKRNACLINNDNFKIRSNRTSTEVTIDRQEAFLSQIEYSLQVSPEWHLKKKLCSVLERDKAYNLLKSYKDCQLDGDTFKITLSQHCALTDRDRSIILSQVKATHERIDLATDTGTAVARLEIIMPLESQSLKPTFASPADQNMGKSRAGGYSQSLGLGIWSTIRQAIINYHGERGEALDQSWFSRLESEVDEQNKTIKLKAPSSFFKDWISNHYGQVLDIFSKKHHYHIQVC